MITKVAHLDRFLCSTSALRLVAIIEPSMFQYPRDGVSKVLDALLKTYSVLVEPVTNRSPKVNDFILCFLVCQPDIRVQWAESSDSCFFMLTVTTCTILSKPDVDK